MFNELNFNVPGPCPPANVKTILKAWNDKIIIFIFECQVNIWNLWVVLTAGSGKRCFNFKACPTSWTAWQICCKYLLLLWLDIITTFWHYMKPKFEHLSPIQLSVRHAFAEGSVFTCLGRCSGKCGEHVTRGHIIVADGWAGAYNSHPHPKPHSRHKHSKDIQNAQFTTFQLDHHVRVRNFKVFLWRVRGLAKKRWYLTFSIYSSIYSSNFNRRPDRPTDEFVESVLLVNAH